MEDSNKLSFFFLGIGVGIAAGILFAPKPGEETRGYLKSKADESRGYLQRRGGELKETASDLVDRGKRVLDRQRDHVSEAVDVAKRAYRESVETPAGL